MSIKRDIVFRVALVYLVLFSFALVIAAKLVILQFINDKEWKEKAEDNHIKNFIITPHRGDIYATDMRLLASSVPYYEVRMDMATQALTDKIFYSNIDSLSLCLAKLFRDKSKNDYKAELVQARRKGHRYYPVKRHVNYLQLKKLKQFPIFRLGRYEGGIIIVQKNQRKLPHGDLASRTIGYTNKGNDFHIRVGLEGAYDNYLAGIEGVQRMQKLSGNVWMPIDDAGEIEPQDGNSIVTTVDVNLQDLAERALYTQLSKHKAHHGTAVVMEVKTGKVKAIANLTLVNGEYREVYNYAVGESTEPGSTFKLPAIIAALDDGYIKLEDTVDTEDGRFQYYDVVISDVSSRKGGYGKITVQEVFEKSSNVGMAKIITSAYKSQPHRFIDKLYRMNLNEPLGLSINGEGKPEIKYPGDPYWDGVTLASMSYGYSLKLTPMQILTFYNAIANDGEMVRPKFIEEVRDHGKVVRTYGTEVINPAVCSRSTLKKVRIMLEGVVEKGTAVNLKNADLKIAGKTGTARIYNTGKGYEMDGKVSYQASFVGYFPADEPRYSCIVVVNSPTQNVYYGNYVAGPVFMEIANKIYATSLNINPAINARKIKNLEVPYSKSGNATATISVLKSLEVKIKDKHQGTDWIITTKTDDHVEIQNKRIIENLMPDVTSMGLSDALYILEGMGLRVSVKGRGSVRRQSIPSGTRINKGDRVELEMSFTEG